MPLLHTSIFNCHQRNNRGEQLMAPPDTWPSVRLAGQLYHTRIILCRTYNCMSIGCTMRTRCACPNCAEYIIARYQEFARCAHKLMIRRVPNNMDNPLNKQILLTRYSRITDALKAKWYSPALRTASYGSLLIPVNTDAVFVAAMRQLIPGLVDDKHCFNTT